MMFMTAIFRSKTQKKKNFVLQVVYQQHNTICSTLLTNVMTISS